MDTNSSKEEIRQISEADKEILLDALSSAKQTRKRVRKNIKNATLPKIPKVTDTFLGDEVA